MYSLIQLKTLVSFGRHRFRRLPSQCALLLIPVILACFASMSQMRAGEEAPDVSPPPDGAYGGNTAEGYQALFHLTSGGFNSGLGWRSLYTLTTGSFNTGVGAGTLAISNAAEDTATGAGALLLKTQRERIIQPLVIARWRTTPVAATTPRLVPLLFSVTTPEAKMWPWARWQAST